MLALVGAATAEPAFSQEPPVYRERVDVMRLMLDARVLDDRGEPVRGLTANDFIVKVGGKAARVESALWVGGGELPDAPSSGADFGEDTGLPAAEGRLIVFLFQKSLEPSRIVGFMRMLIEARGLLASLSPRDRVAVLSFDSSLHVWVDFTNDYARVRRIFEQGILFERAGPVQESAGMSLVRRLAAEEAHRTYSIERALDRIGSALADLPGAKSIVLVGHGFGRFGATGVAMENAYEPMRESLQRARASVFSLDVTTADYHSLEAGLQLVAEDTGGFFARTHIFTSRAVRTLLGALAGHYTLFVELPALDEGVHRTRIELNKKAGNVLARSTYVMSSTLRADQADASCRPTPSSTNFVPPSPYPGTPPGESAFWYGSPALWTSLPVSGAWNDLPRADHAYRQKVFLWRVGYDGRAEQWPHATVMGRRVDGEGEPLVAERATNAYHRSFGGWAMLVEVEVPSAGCWEMTALYGDASLEFTVRILP